MRKLPRVAALQAGVFSTVQAQAEGWTASALRHATTSGRLVRVRAGAYQPSRLDEIAELDRFEQARWRHAAPGVGAALATPGAVASHSTAAVLLGLPLLFLPSRACVSVRPWNTGAMPHVHLHRCTAPPPGFPQGWVDATSTERTLLDLGREHGVRMSVVAMDFALHAKLTSFVKLATELRSMSRWPGVRSAREAMDLADPRSESPLETLSRLEFPKFGLPIPEPQVSIGNEWGGFVARVDFYWDEFGVVGEVDGDVKYAGDARSPLLREKRRQKRLADLDLEVVRWGWSDVRNFDQVARQLRRAFARGAHRPAAERFWRVLPPDFDLSMCASKID